MPNPFRERLLKFGIPGLAVILIAIQFYNAHTQNLSKWKGGGYGMYTELHYIYNQVHIVNVSVDSLQKHNPSIKKAIHKVKLMPNRTNLQEAGEHILKITNKDSIHIQLWKPQVRFKQQSYTRVLMDELFLKATDF
ncbi:hypothetical protein ES711_02245 [Gelidibacter salicanalis]|uniref:Uncharacterized protein n=1 Tax=Gelidibacter salicanalis TaxID=291193 RepID=A0A5C7ASZ0_9FLAO|nr:hypothetical protein [Gelidibacter salicanalis]TXE10749.1 hypothetical protein ES711_02245 [Gelidibacter salicanalis]